MPTPSNGWHCSGTCSAVSACRCSRICWRSSTSGAATESSQAMPASWSCASPWAASCWFSGHCGVSEWICCTEARATFSGLHWASYGLVLLFGRFMSGTRAGLFSWTSDPRHRYKLHLVCGVLMAAVAIPCALNPDSRAQGVTYHHMVGMVFRHGTRPFRSARSRSDRRELFCRGIASPGVLPQPTTWLA